MRVFNTNKDIIAIFVFLTFFLLMSVPITMYVSFQYEVRRLVIYQLSVPDYKVKQSNIVNAFSTPSGRWWIELDYGFSLKTLEGSPYFFNANYDSSVVADALINTMWDTDFHGFTKFYSQHVPDDTSYCSSSGACDVIIYAKDGDRNIFITIVKRDISPFFMRAKVKHRYGQLN